jgi:hypothetical protein
MRSFQVGEYWASPQDVLWRVAATDESPSVSYAALVRVKKAKGRITVPMGATRGWELIATDSDMRAVENHPPAKAAISTLIRGLR